MAQRKNKKAVFKFDNETMLLSSKTSFATLEAFKTLRTNVIFSLPGNGCKTIGVTSGNRSEGKSLTSINLALSFAQLGKRVIIIDCDLRIPSIAAKLNIPNNDGLSNYLVGTSNDDNLNIVEFGDPSISVVTSGSIPPDPTALLSSDSMKTMLDELKNTFNYDYIILDFPPVFLVWVVWILWNSPLQLPRINQSLDISFPASRLILNAKPIHDFLCSARYRAEIKDILLLFGHSVHLCGGWCIITLRLVRFSRGWCIYMVLFSRDCYYELFGFLIVRELHLDTRVHGSFKPAPSAGIG